MLLRGIVRVFDDMDTSLVDSREVDNEHGQTACPTVSLLEGALDLYVWSGMLEERWFDVESHVLLAGCVVGYDGRLGWSEV